MTGMATPAAPRDDVPSEPLAERLISDVETLKALSDPLRIQILETMVQDWTEPWSVKRLAKALGVMPTKLYHHIKILEERDLIRPASQQLVRGIVETTYRIAQLSLRLDRGLIAQGTDDLRSSAHEAITSVFELARRDLDQALASGLAPTDPSADPRATFLINRSVLRLRPERAAELRARLDGINAEFSADPPAPDSIALGMLVSVHPIAGPVRAKARS